MPELHHRRPRRKQTICEMHRRMYRIIMRRDPDDELLPILRKAFDMGKKISNKLQCYRNKYGDEWWEAHKLDGGEIDAAQDD